MPGKFVRTLGGKDIDYSNEDLAGVSDEFKKRDPEFIERKAKALREVYNKYVNHNDGRPFFKENLPQEEEPKRLPRDYGVLDKEGEAGWQRAQQKLNEYDQKNRQLHPENYKDYRESMSPEQLQADEENKKKLEELRDFNRLKQMGAFKMK